MPDPDFDRFRTALCRREPDRVPLENLNAMREAVREFGTYPIRL